MLVDSGREGLQGGVDVGQGGVIKLRVVQRGGPGSLCAGQRGSHSDRSPGAPVVVALGLPNDSLARAETKGRQGRREEEGGGRREEGEGEE